MSMKKEYKFIISAYVDAKNRKLCQILQKKGFELLRRSNNGIETIQEMPLLPDDDGSIYELIYNATSSNRELNKEVINILSSSPITKFTIERRQL
ncbi:hypothetical protein IKF30_03300 [Candidatus Saccharibacteria bacterium]|nr:hypothetical protein [Candidatus Saccharibacteria bacterium]